MFKMDCQKNTTYLIKIFEDDKYRFKSKEKPKYVKKKPVRKKNIKGLALKNKIVQQNSTCVDCGSKKSTFLKRLKHQK